MLLVITMISIIVLCTVYEVYKNKEIAQQRAIEQEVLEKAQQAKVSADMDKTEDAPDTERQMLSDNVGDKSVEMGAKKASRVKAGDHSVI